MDDAINLLSFSIRSDKANYYTSLQEDNETNDEKTLNFQEDENLHLVDKIKKELLDYLDSLYKIKDMSIAYKQLNLFNKDINREVEFSFKCSMCRKLLFTDLDLDFYHQYTPKQQYSFKRYKQSFVRTNECSSYFIRDVEEIFVKRKYDKNVKGLKVEYKYEDFFNTHMSIKLQCTKCAAKIGEYYPCGMQCSCGSWVVPGCQIIKSKVDKAPIKIDYSNLNVAVPFYKK